LERQNQSLAEEVRQLRQELAEAGGQPPKAAPPLDEKVAVDESRVEELAQSKVEASQRFPIRVTGMALFNGFLNSKGSGGQQYPLFAWPGNLASGGGTLYQTTLGLDYSGPQAFLGGKVHGNVYMDFAGGSGAPLDLGFRLRTGEIEIDWADRSIMAGVVSPIFPPRQPPSPAQATCGSGFRRCASSRRSASRTKPAYARNSAPCKPPRSSRTCRAHRPPSPPGQA